MGEKKEEGSSEILKYFGICIFMYLPFSISLQKGAHKCVLT